MRSARRSASSTSGHQEHGAGAVAADLAQEVTHLQPGEGVERGERLVQQENRRLADERARQANALRHTAGELVGPGALRCRTDRRAPASPLASPRPERHARPGQRSARRSSRARAAAPGRPSRSEGRSRSPAAADPDLTRRGGVEASHEPEQGALAATAGAQDGHELAGRRLEVNPLQDRDLTSLSGKDPRHPRTETASATRASLDRD